MQTGSQWILDEFGKRLNGEPTNVGAAFITAQLVRRQFEDDPVHSWNEAEALPKEIVDNIYSYAGGIMTTDIYTVNEDDLIDRVSNKLIKRLIRTLSNFILSGRSLYLSGKACIKPSQNAALATSSGIVGPAGSNLFSIRKCGLFFVVP